MKAHASITDGLYNYWCTAEGCNWRYAHVGSGSPDLIAERKFTLGHVYNNDAYWWGGHDEVTRDHNNERG